MFKFLKGTIRVPTSSCNQLCRFTQTLVGIDLLLESCMVYIGIDRCIFIT